MCVCDQRVSVPWRKKSRDHSEAMGRIRKEENSIRGKQERTCEEEGKELDNEKSTMKKYREKEKRKEKNRKRYLREGEDGLAEIERAKKEEESKRMSMREIYGRLNRDNRSI